MLIPRRVSRRDVLANYDALAAAYVDSQVALEVEKQARHVAQLRAQRLQDDLNAVTSAKRNWAEDIASLRRELEAAETAAVTAHKRADEWEAEAAQFKKLADTASVHSLVRHVHYRRLIRTLWASRRRYQADLAQERRAADSDGRTIQELRDNAAVDHVELATARREIEELRAKLAEANESLAAWEQDGYLG